MRKANTDARGRLAALSVGIPQFMLSSTLPVRFALQFFGTDGLYDGVTAHDNLAYYGRFAKLTQGVRRLGSAALDLSYVAAGRVDGYWELSIKPWDVAAGGLIASEAGATVTNMAGQADYITPPCSLLAAPPGLHAKMKAMLNE